MRSYEVVFIVHPDLDENAMKGVVDKVSGWVTEAGGTVSSVENWGKRRMAYQIQKQRDGQYVMFKVEMAPAFSAELERNLRFLEPVMRFQIIAK